MLRLLAATVAVGPCLIVLVLGALYLYDCFQRILAPGVPAVFRYKAQGGEVTLRAETFDFDLGRMSGTARRITARDWRGNLIASADRLTGKYPAGVVTVRGEGIFARIERLPGGGFSIVEQLPKQSQERGDTPYSVELARVRLEYVDAARWPRLVTRASAPLVRVAGIGRRSRAAATATIVGAGSVPIELALDVDRFRFRTRLDRLQGAGLWQQARRWLDEKQLASVYPLNAGSLLISGPVLFEKLPKGENRLAASLRIDARGLTAGDYARAASVTGDAELTLAGAAGTVRVDEPGRSGTFAGRIAWGDTLKMSGTLEARADSLASLPEPLRKAIPRDLAARSPSFSGVVSIEGGKYRVDGDVAASLARYRGQTVRDAKGRLVLSDQAFRAQDVQAVYEGVRARGSIAANLRTKSLSGFFDTEPAQLGPLARRFGMPGVSGVGVLRGIVAGTPSAPQVGLSALGTARFRPSGRAPIDIGFFQARGSLRSGQVALSRLSAQGPNGSLSATGTADLNRRTLALDWKAGGINLSRFSKEIEGLAFAEGRATGTFDKPTAVGRLEVYAAKIADRMIPTARAAFAADRGSIRLDDASALFGAGNLSGSARLDLRTKALTGAFAARGVSLSELIDESFAGRMDAQGLRLSGTLDAPRIAGTVRSDSVLAYGIPAAGGEARIEATKDGLSFSQAKLNIGEGSEAGVVRASGSYRFGAKSGTIAASIEQAPLQKLLVGQEQRLKGTVNGAVQARIADGRVASLSLQAKITDAAFGETKLGSGEVAVRKEGSIYTADGSLGLLDRTLTLENARYDEATEKISGKLDAYALPINDLRQVFAESLASAPQNVQEALAQIAGSVSASTQIGGTAKRPALDVTAFNTEDLKVAGRDAGRIDATLLATAERVDLRGFAWRDGDSRFGATGFVEPKGAISLDGELNNFDLTWLAALVPGLPAFSGLADVSLAVTGKTENPDASATLQTSKLSTVDASGKVQELPLKLGLDEITLRDGAVVARGDFNYQGISGTLDGSASIDALLNRPNPRLSASGDEIALSANLKRTDIGELAKRLKWLDPKRTQGEILGSVSISRRGGVYRYAGDIGGDGLSIASTEADTVLQKVNARLKIAEGELTATAAGDSSSGGRFDIWASSRLPSTFSAQETAQDVLADLALKGRASMEGFAVAINPNRASTRIVGSASGAVDLGGTLARPRISGIPGQPIVVSGADVALPSEFAASGESLPLPVVPEFGNIVVALAPGTRLRTSTASLSVGGTGTIAGDLTNPNINADLDLLGGVVRLPTARVTLEEGGKINFVYRPSQGIFASRSSESDIGLYVDIEGRTYVTARRFSDVVERYDVTLRMSGNLLDANRENALQIVATSDPPDLSSDRIMALLGQKELIEGIGGTALTNPIGDSALRNVFLGFGLPTLTSPLTEGIATGLGLDYVSVEYNPLDLTTVSAAKSLTKNLVLFARRGLQRDVRGRLLYEMRLTYRPQTRNRLLSRVRLFAGFDQDRPWKVGFDYSFRF